MMIVSTDARTGLRMLSSEMFMRRRVYSTVSSFTGSPSRSCNVPEVMSVSPTLSPSMIWMLESVRSPVFTSAACALPPL